MKRTLRSLIALSLAFGGISAAQQSARLKIATFETKFVDRWRTRLQSTYPELSVGSGNDDGYGLSRYLRDEFPTAFGSVSVVAARSSFLEGTPVRWDRLKKVLLETLPQD